MAAPAPRIDDYALIGDSRSAALVSRAGSLDWLCWPRFDSPAIFARILDRDAGHFSLAPRGAISSKRSYAADSNVLVTEFESREGVVRLFDFMSVFSEREKRDVLVPEHEILRIVEGVSGSVEIEARFAPRPDYARRAARLRSLGPLGVRLESGAELYTFRSSVPLEIEGSASAAARFRIDSGERRYFSLAYDAHGPAVLPPLGDGSDRALERTLAFWRAFAGRSTYQGPYREAVVRSLLAVKLLSFAPSGAVVAAPTTSLPERVGGDLNWDYRFCWLRDAAFTVRALLALGHGDEAAAFGSWLLHATRLTRPELRVLYDVYGEIPDEERELPHLSGYLGSRPVRVGNAASDQLQLDTYGEVIDAVAQLSRHDGGFDRETRRMLVSFGEYVCKNWQEPDHGIWEARETRRHYTHSRVLCWAALDRLLELAREGVLPGAPVERFTEQRARIRADVETNAWNERLGTYTQVLGGDGVDASLLLLPWYGFAAADDARMRRTFQRVEERLGAPGGLLYRYEASREAGEGAFGLCGFWAVEFFARGGGTLAEAEERFTRLLSHANDVGLLAEEVAPESGDGLGNFPQAYTHVGVIGAAVAIEERRRRAS